MVGIRVRVTVPQGFVRTTPKATTNQSTEHRSRGAWGYACVCVCAWVMCMRACVRACVCKVRVNARATVRCKVVLGFMVRVRRLCAYACVCVCVCVCV